MDDEDNNSHGDIETIRKKIKFLLNSILKTRCVTKRMRFNEFISLILESYQTKYSHLLVQQHSEREKVIEEYQTQVLHVFKQWKEDIELYAYAENKLETIRKELKTNLQQRRFDQEKQHEESKEIFDNVIQSCSNLSLIHSQQLLYTRKELEDQFLSTTLF